MLMYLSISIKLFVRLILSPYHKALRYRGGISQSWGLPDKSRSLSIRHTCFSFPPGPETTHKHSSMSNYEGTEDWADVDPIAQNEGGPNPLAAIAYTEEYSEAMSYLRAVMAKNEMSQRVLDLTEHIIGMNPAHYTVW